MFRPQKPTYERSCSTILVSALPKDSLWYVNMSPDEIREIREVLGLTQTEAGTLLGGGPRAFAKYEAGVVQPSAGLVKLLRLLDREPQSFAAIADRRRGPNTPLAETPFTLTGDEVMRLREFELPGFLRLLLHAEAEACGLPVDDIHVAEDYVVADGGEDAHIRWDGGPDRTSQLPGRYIQFQLKTGNMAPAKASGDVLARDGAIKPMVRDALEAGGHYVLICASPLTAKKAKTIVSRIHDATESAGLRVPYGRIHVWDGNQLAAWSNRYPALVIQIKEWTRSSATGPFQSWIQWADRPEHALSPLVPDERLQGLKEHLVPGLARAGTVLRVVGASGIGKSRLVLESLGLERRDDQTKGPPLREFVLYADHSEADATAICGAVRTLADISARAIVIVDNCPPDTRRRLEGIVVAPRSRLSLATVDDEAEPSSRFDPSTISVPAAPSSVTEAIIDRELPALPSEDRRRLFLFSRGYPAIAVQVANAWAVNKPISYATDDDFVNAFVSKRNDAEPNLTIRTAMLVAAFGTIRHTSDDSASVDLAQWGDMNPDEMHAALQRLINCGVVHRRGRDVILQPRPVAMRLTERQWLAWNPKKRLALLAGTLDPSLKVNAARQLAWINDSDVAHEAADLYLRPGGPLDGTHGLSQPGRADFLYFLAQVDAGGATDSLRRTLDDVDDPSKLRPSIRRTFLNTLQTIAFAPSTFPEAASLMLRLAVHETEPRISNNATGQFAGLFPIHQGATAADGAARLAVLEEATNANDPQQRTVVVQALLAGANTTFVSRLVGAESHGSRPALTPWSPKTRKEAMDYVTFCVERLADEAKADDNIGATARKELGHQLRALVTFGLIDVVESVVENVSAPRGTWPEAIASLGDFLRFDAQHATPDTCEQVRALIERLQPQTLADRIRALVSNMPWDYPNGEILDYDDQVARQLATVRAIAKEAVEQTPVLVDQLPHLCKGNQRWAAAFGEFLADGVPVEPWLHSITDAVSRIPHPERNFDLLAGFLKGISSCAPNTVAAFKLEAANSPELATALPAICARLGLVPTDVPLAVQALRKGSLTPSSLTPWAFGDALANLPTGALNPLLEELSDHGADGLPVVLDLLAMLAHGASERLEGHRPRLLTLASAIADPSMAPIHTMAADGTETLFGWLLVKGRDDPDACALALTLSRALVRDDAPHGTIRLLTPLFPTLLSRFAEIAWPLIGSKLVEPGGTAWVLRDALTGSRPPHRENRPAILHLPADSLFAWCSAHPDEAPRCAARMLPFLASDDPEPPMEGLHPLFLRLIDQFGDREEVLEATATNILFNFTWVGSLTTYFGRFLGPLNTLEEHATARVARWAARMHRHLVRQINDAQSHDDEYQARFEV